MAYIAGYEYDIFISYSHKDDVALISEKGWVEQFHELLENWLINLRGLDGLKICFDKKRLSSNTYFDDALENSISSSALFFVIHSRNYQKSEYCRKELDWFISHNLGSGIRIGEKSRIFNILIDDIHHDDWPEALAGTSGTNMYDDKIAMPTLLNKPEQIGPLIKETINTLELVSKPTITEKRLVEKSKPKIFIADTADTLVTYRKRLISEIGDKAEVLDLLPPPYEKEQHRQALDNSLQQADLTVHLIDQYPGKYLDHQSNDTFSQIQASEAISRNTESLIWTHHSFQLESIDDSHHAEWLQGTINSRRSDSRFEYFHGGRQVFLDHILQKIEEMESTVSAITNNTSVLIDTHQKDQLYAFDLATALSRKEIPVHFNKEFDDPAQSLAGFKTRVNQVQNLVIMFGNVAPEWLKGRIDEALKAVTNTLISGECLLKTIWIYLPPNSPGQDKIPSYPPLLKIQALDNRHSSTVDENLVKTLLK